MGSDFTDQKVPMAAKSFGDLYGSLILSFISVYVLEKK